MWLYLWQRGMLSLAMTLGCACALLAGPPGWSDSIRIAMRDAAGPAGNAALKLEDWTSVRWSELRQHISCMILEQVGTIVAPPESSADEAGMLMKQRELEFQVAALQEQLDSERREQDHLLRTSASQALVCTVAVPARVLGRERAALERLADRLIGAGTAAGIDRGDLVTDQAITDEGESGTVIDQGRDADLRADLPVIAGGTLVGRIRSCGRWTSSVQVVSDPDFRVAAQLVRMTPEGPVFGAAGLFAGGTPCRFEHVSNTEPVAVGDRVYTHEEIAGGEIALFIGTISSAEVIPGDPHWRLEVAPAGVTPPAAVEVLKVELNPRRVSADESKGGSHP